MRPASLVRIATAFVLAIAPLASLHAQAGSTASKNLDINAFGGLAIQKPDYGPDRNTGGVFGANITRYFYHFPVPIGAFLEVRGTFASGIAINESTYVGGFGVKSEFLHRYHPYIDYLAGYGKITFATPPFPGYTHDNALALNYGGGIDIDVYRHFALKLDAQRQSMNFGSTSIRLNPVNYVIGVNYTIPFRGLGRHK